MIRQWVSPGDPGSHTFQYRQVAFAVPDGFLDEYIRHRRVTQHDGLGTGYGVVSGVGETLDNLWPEYRADAASAIERAPGGGLDRFWDNLRGCWDLPPERLSPSFNNKFFTNRDNPPAKAFFTQLCAIAATYAPFLDDLANTRPADGEVGTRGPFADADPICKGYASFVREILLHGRAPKRYGGFSTLTIHAQADASAPGDCGYSFRPETSIYYGSTPVWDAWTLVWDASNFIWRVQPDGSSTIKTDSARPPGPTTVGAPAGSRSVLAVTASASNQNVYFHPCDIGAMAAIVDRILDTARLAQDFYIHGSGSVRYLDIAREIAAYALRLISDWSRVLTHELGHLYLSGEHCVWGCCFDNALIAWRCALIAHLGLPINPYVSTSTTAMTDFDAAHLTFYNGYGLSPTAGFESWGGGPSDHNLRCYHGSLCWLDRAGVAGSGYAVCLTLQGCSTPTVGYVGGPATNQDLPTCTFV